jgi:hypothetical protein
MYGVLLRKNYRYFKGSNMNTLDYLYVQFGSSMVN